MDRRFDDQRCRPPRGVAAQRRLLVIFNPAAGGARDSRLRRVVEALERLGCSVVVRRTTAAAGDAERLAREAEADFDVIVAAGGDGTVNQVANGLRLAGRPLAVVPLGTANVLANEIGLPRNPERLAAVIAYGEPRPIWPGRVGERLFLMMVGSGFDAEVIDTVDPRLKRVGGKFAFLCAIIIRLCRYRRCELSVEIDGVAHRAASVVVAKGHYYAGRFVLAPAARIGDPILYVVLFRGAGRLATLRCLGAIALGLVHRLSDVSIVGARAVWIAGAAPGAVEADGEITARLPVSITLADAPILLVQPA